jgi:hypothetical protein
MTECKGTTSRPLRHACENHRDLLNLRPAEIATQQPARIRTMTRALRQHDEQQIHALEMME